MFSRMSCFNNFLTCIVLKFNSFILFLLLKKVIPAIFVSHSFVGSKNGSFVSGDIGKIYSWVKTNLTEAFSELLLEGEHTGSGNGGVVTVSPDRDDNVGEGSLRDEQVFSFTLVLDYHIFTTFFKTMEVAVI